MTQFARALLFFNATLCPINPLLQIWDHKFLGNREICHMFTKNNTRGSKMNGCGSFAGKLGKFLRKSVKILD